LIKIDLKGLKDYQSDLLFSLVSPVPAVKVKMLSEVKLRVFSNMLLHTSHLGSIPGQWDPKSLKFIPQTGFYQLRQTLVSYINYILKAYSILAYGFMGILYLWQNKNTLVVCPLLYASSMCNTLLSTFVAYHFRRENEEFINCWFHLNSSLSKDLDFVKMWFIIPQINKWLKGIFNKRIELKLWIQF